MSRPRWFGCICGRHFTTRSGLGLHRAKCSAVRESLDRLRARIDAESDDEAEPCLCDTDFTCLATHP